VLACDTQETTARFVSKTGITITRKCVVLIRRSKPRRAK
jgi:hypothetical protein